jgi:nucleoside-diphosphate-sugar epimerase
MGETVVVTGGTGFVARWAIAGLLERGYTVRATVRDASRAFPVRDPALSFRVADLTGDAGWDEAVGGADYVLHIASPLGGSGERSLIEAARDGTRRVLRAATRAGVRRVVLTSSTAACTRSDGTPGDESVWSDPAGPGVNAYRRSKILAERAAWDFMAAAGGRTELATVLPGAIFGPVPDRGQLGSAGLIKRMLDGRLPGTPRVGFSIVDVRDLAALHIAAMTAPEAAGERFIAAGEFRWMREIARTLRDGLGERAARVPRRDLPDLAVRALALASPDLRSITPLLGRRRAFSAAKAAAVLGFTPRPPATTILDCARSLLTPERAART